MSVVDQGFAVFFLTGLGGDGKSYVTVHELVRRRLVEWDHDVWTNLPLNVEAVATYVAALRGCKPHEVAQRINIIDDNTLTEWAEGHSGPWHLTDDFEAKGDLIIDEVHVFCPRKDQKRETLWQKWLGEARHDGWQRVQFITQAPEKVSPVIEQHSHVKYALEKADRRRTRWFKFPMSDVYQLIASFTRKYQPMVHRLEFVKDANGKWKKARETIFSFLPEIFALYNSHSARGGKSEATGAGTPPPMEWEWRPRFWPRRMERHGKQRLVAPTWLWFMRRNVWRFAWMAPFVVVFWLLLSGNLGVASQYVTKPVFGLFQPSSSRKEPGRAKEKKGPRRAAQAVAADGGMGARATGDEPGLELVRALAARVEEDSVRLREAGGVVCIGVGFVALRNGDVYSVGETILAGPHAGKRVHGIDYQRRQVALHDGTVLWLRPAGAEDDAEAAAEVSELLQRAHEYAGRHGSELEPIERSVVTKRFSNAPGVFPAAPGPEVGAVDRGAGRPRR